METVSVIGAGAWGTALAQALAEGGKTVKLWAREPDVVRAINEKHENKTYLPNIPLHEDVVAVESLAEACNSDVLMIVTPTQAVRSILSSIRSADLRNKYVVICSKGFEIGTGLLLSQVAAEEIPTTKVLILTGPTFASEVVRGLPSGMTIAAKDKEVAKQVRDFIGTKKLRPYASDDLIGTQIGGATKNVIAIAAGISDGRGLGESARAALITRGLAEMARLTSTMGGKRETLMGMCGVGDLMLTCTSMQSRNYSLGYRLGKGEDQHAILSDRHSVTEGVHTAKALVVLAKKQAVEMPISETVYAVLHEDMSVETAVEEMLSRPFGKEL